MNRKNKGRKVDKKSTIKRKPKLPIGLFIILGILTAFTAVGIVVLAGFIKDTYYPSGIMQTGGLSAFTRMMDKPEYMPLRDIVTDISNEGAGILISPLDDDNTSFNYTSDTYATLYTSASSGIIVVGKGSGSAEEDIKAHTGDFYDFVGSIDPSYKEKVHEEGTANGFSGIYSAGYLSTGNFFKKGGFYVVSLELLARENEFFFISYATEDISELKSHAELILRFATKALEGGTPQNTEPLVQKSDGVAGTVTESELKTGNVQESPFADTSSTIPDGLSHGEMLPAPDAASYQMQDSGWPEPTEDISFETQTVSGNQ